MTLLLYNKKLLLSFCKKNSLTNVRYIANDKKEKQIFSLPSIFIFPLVKSLKNLYIAPVPSSLVESLALLPPLMILRNSPNSRTPEPSSSTISTILFTCCLLSTSPRAIRGSSSSSAPILPMLWLSKELKYVLSCFSYSSEKSMQ